MKEKPSAADDPGLPIETGNGGDEDEDERKPVRKRRPKPEKLTDEQLDALAKTAFTFGAFLMEGMIYAANKWRKKQEE